MADRSQGNLNSARRRKVGVLVDMDDAASRPHVASNGSAADLSGSLAGGGLSSNVENRLQSGETAAPGRQSFNEGDNHASVGGNASGADARRSEPRAGPRLRDILQRTGMEDLVGTAARSGMARN